MATFSKENLSVLPTTGDGYYEIPVKINYDIIDSNHQPYILNLRAYTFTGTTQVIPNTGGFLELIDVINNGIANGVTIKVVNGSGVFRPTAPCTFEPNTKYNNWTCLYFHGDIIFKFFNNAGGKISFDSSQLKTISIVNGDFPINLTTTIESPLAFSWSQTNQTSLSLGFTISTSGNVQLSAGTVSLYTFVRSDNVIAKVYGYPSNEPSTDATGAASLFFAFFNEDIVDVSKYTITVTESDFGTCIVDKEEAEEGETVRVVTTPNLGQKLYRLYVVGDSVGAVSVQTESDNVHTFVMPADNVKVSAIFMSNDAYVPAGTDEEDLGGGDYDDTSDPVPVPPVPSISASNIGMVTLFRPSLQNILDLGQYLYTDWWELGDNLKKWLSNPIEAMIGFNIVPCVPAVTTERVVKLGIVSTGVSMPPVVSQWYDFDCGTVDIVPYTGTMLDYAPNTKIQIMLPFIGSSALDTDEVMNRTLGLKYRIDLLSGACVAMVTINGDVRYQWTGECAVNIPFSASDFSRVYGAVLGAVGAGVTGFMAAGAAGVASQAAASAATTQAMNNNLAASKAFKEALGDVVKGSRGAPALREKLKTASQQTMDKAIAEAGNGTRIAGAIKATQIARAVNNVVGNVMSAKGGVSHSGTISGAAGMLGVRTPYVIIEYPNQSLPVDYRHFVGYPSNITATLGELTGYTECEQLIAEGITGTDGEYTELVEALKGGVYL